MRFVFACVLGWLLIVAAAAAAAWDLLGPRAAGAPRLRPAGQLWYEIDSGSLNLVQAVIERYVWAPLWDPAIATVLLAPAPLIVSDPIRGSGADSAVTIALSLGRSGGRRRPSRVWARAPKISRISPVRSSTLAAQAFSRLRCCTGLSG